MAEDSASSVAAPDATDGSGDNTSATDYYCQVCCEDVQGREAAVARFALSACRHCFCRDCLVGYLSSKVTEGDIAPRCFWSASSSSLLLQTGRHDTEAPPAAPRCREPISEADVEALLLREHPLLWAKFERYRFFKLSPSARECPKCSHRQCGDPLRPAMVCGQGQDGEGEGSGGAEAEEKGGGGEGAGCGYEYCFLHAGAHSGLTCAQYEAREQEEISQSRALINESTKPCPVCGLPISKDGGCNHIKCSFCGATFCWLCGQEIEDAVFPAHFQWWNPYGCSNLQMNEQVEPSRLTRFAARASATLEVLVLGPLSVASTAASLLACCCFVPLYTAQLPDRKPEPWSQRFLRLLAHCMSAWGMFWLGLLAVLPLLLVGGILALLLVGLFALVRMLLCLPCRGMGVLGVPVREEGAEDGEGGGQAGAEGMGGNREGGQVVVDVESGAGAGAGAEEGRAGEGVAPSMPPPPGPPRPPPPDLAAWPSWLSGLSQRLHQDLGGSPWGGGGVPTAPDDDEEAAGEGYHAVAARAEG